MTDPTTEHEESICCDTGCTRTLADRDWVQRHYPGTEIRKRSTPMYIRGISEKEVVTSDYAMLRFYFKGIRDGKISVATFVREVTLMDGRKLIASWARQPHMTQLLKRGPRYTTISYSQT
ncbi:hypothetical protein GGR54DRAFT_25087 [Hypoxylon sp. NC1633]|nr:hypothetical protein GGR54DRAFT_25087 [Hypoxylon sp. NC1633]